jgi:flagellar biosynthesis chaperone FliJ
MARFDGAREKASEQVSKAEDALESALSDLESILDRYETTLDSYETDDDYDQGRYEEAVDRMARLYSDTAETIEDELSEIGLSFSDVESDVDEYFDATIRNKGFENLANESSFSQYY